MSLFQETISAEHCNEIRITTPPCVQEAGNQELKSRAMSMSDSEWLICYEGGSTGADRGDREDLGFAQIL